MPPRKNVCLFATISLFFFFPACAILSKNGQPDIKGIKITQIVPVFSNDWSVSRYDTILIFRYSLNREIVFDFPAMWKSYKENALDSTSVIHTYVAYSKGDTTAFKFSSFPKANEESVMLDSVFEALPKIDLNSFFSDSNNVVLQKKIKDPDSGLLTEEYFLTKKRDTSFSSVLTLGYSDRIKADDYSFSEKYDSIKRMKLVVVKLTTPPKYYAAINKTQSAFSITFKIEEVEPENQELLKYYFDKVARRKKINTSY